MYGLGMADTQSVRHSAYPFLFLNFFVFPENLRRNS